jgi:excinuclease ABC subunit C
MKRLRTAQAEEIASVQGIGPALARSVVDALAASSPEPAVDMATGEVLD